MADRDERNLIEHEMDTPRLAWTSPAVARIDANDAEQGSNGATDLGVTFS